MRLDPGPRAPAMDTVPRPELPAYYRSLYRIKPDRRILYALTEIDRLAANRRKPATLALRFEDERWQVRIDGEVAGSLPELPKQADWEKLLADWTLRCLKTHGVRPGSGDAPEIAAFERDLTQGSTDRVVAALARLNALAAARPFHPRLLEAAARGAIWLSVQTYDDLQISDPLVGHALALVMLARNFTPDSLVAETALLYARMGYQAAASAVSQTLPPTDPIRLFAEADAPALAKAASAPGAEPRTHYLHLLTTARAGAREALLDAQRRSPWASRVDPATLCPLLLLRDFALDHSAPQALSASAFLSVAASEAPSESKAALWGPEAWPEMALDGYLEDAGQRVSSALESQTRSFESHTDRKAEGADGPLFDRESFRAFYRAAFYSGMHARARFLLDQLASTPAAEQYEKTFDHPAPGTAEELLAWMRVRIATNRSQGGPAETLEKIDAFRHIGLAPVARAVYAVTGKLASGTDPADRAGVRIVFRRLDARPDNSSAAWVAAYELQDLRLGERLMRAFVEMAPRGNDDLLLRLAYRTRDSAQLRRIATDRKYSVNVRTAALADLGLMNDPDTAFRKARYFELMDEEPELTGPLDRCVNLLRNTKDVPGALAATHRWLARRPVKERDLSWAHVVTLQANLLGEQKKWSEAWKTIEPALRTGKGEVLASAAWILEERGNWDDALEMAKSIRQRYPEDSGGVVTAARVLWRQRKYVEAAGLLSRSPVVRRSDWDGEVATSFGSVFHDADPHDTRNAFGPLVELGVDAKALAALAREIGRRGDPRLAAALLSQIRATGSDESAIQIWTHDELLKAEGEEAATAWLLKTTRAGHQLGIVAFQFQRYDILWALEGDPARATKDDEMQLMRAAALIHKPEPSCEPYYRLLQYFGGRPRKGWAPFGLFLLGSATPEEVYVLSDGLPGICNLGWLMGLKAAGEGRYEEASDWFQVSVESGQPRVPPNAWSFEILRRWMVRDLFLRQLQAEKTL